MDRGLLIVLGSAFFSLTLVAQDQDQEQPQGPPPQHVVGDAPPLPPRFAPPPMDRPDRDKKDRERPDRDKDKDHPNRDKDRSGKDWREPPPDMPDGLRKRYDRMTPEEREHFLGNYEKWKKLSPEEREKLRKDEGGSMRKDFFRRAVDDALKEAGLNLSPEDREEFAMRYAQERRKLEEEIHSEMDRLRQERLPVLVDSLKKEFADRNQPGSADGAKDAKSSN